MELNIDNVKEYTSEKMINTIFNAEIDGIQTAFFGRPSSKFNDSTIRELGRVDVLIIQSNLLLKV